jgi:hypothetical protein
MSSASPNPPNLQTNLRPPFFFSVVALRSVWVILITLALQSLFPLGSSTILVAASGVAGVIFSSYAALSKLRALGFGAIITAIFIGFKFVFWALQELTSLVGPGSFVIDRIAMHTGTCFISALIWACATWAFWRLRSALTIEIVAFFTGALTLFSGHRNFHLDRPKILNQIAWQLKVDHLTMLFIIGSSLLALALLYLYCASLAVRPRLDGPIKPVASPGKRIFSGAISLALLAAVIYFVQSLVYGHYSATMLARVANGVGMGDSPGVSPLSFQSALGSTNQPAALVRLEGDYSNNPFSPMLYLRESALSSFNGREMVFAGRAYDTDLPVTNTRDAFSREEDAELGERTPLLQSMYLLAEHDHAFAADYPVTITQLKNPRPNRFKATYRAYSVAPAYTLSKLSARQVGDPRWTQDVKDHYLGQHNDKRYSDLALKLTKDANTPIEKINAITSYLSKTAIYTLTPNHEVKPNEDPVAAFLFGDNRGYCVHFAHAIVYMARSLGIPARIGTGYLTDLSQAKDGHILLRMSDRHAWAEVNIAGIGWVPFDVQPEQVESHAETQVDAKLLEELMGVLEPGEEILPTENTKDEAGMNETPEYWIPSRAELIWTLVVTAALLALAKLLLRYGWRLAPNSALRLSWAYISAASALHDQGITRNVGETRIEFANRTPNKILLNISQLVVTKAYTSSHKIDQGSIQQAMREFNQRYKLFSGRQRFLSALNPSSVTKALSGIITGRTW